MHFTVQDIFILESGDRIQIDVIYIGGIKTYLVD